MTEPQSNKPITAAEAFEAAGENLRQAETGWNETRVPMDKVAQVIDIANAWTALGVGLANAEPFDAEYPIPIKLVGKPLEPVRYLPGGAIGENELRPRMHDWDEDSGLCREPWCVVHQGEIDALSGCPVLSTPLRRHEHGPNCHHAWLQPMQPCAKGCGARPEEVRSNLPCPVTCPNAIA